MLRLFYRTSKVTLPCCSLEDKVDLAGKVLIPHAVGRVEISTDKVINSSLGVFAEIFY